MSAVVTKGRKFALVLPSTNTSVEREFHHLRPQDCSWHTGRIMIKAPALDSANAFQAFRECLNEALPSALEIVMTCEPDYIVMGMSAETFWGGVQGNAAFEQGVRDMTGLEVTTGATAAGEALKAFGAKRIGVVTPYQPVGDEQVVAYFTELGYDVAAITGLCSASATSIADETPETLRDGVPLRRRPGRGRADPVRHQPGVHRGRRRAREGARQAGHRDQPRHHVARVPGQRHRRQDRRLRLTDGGPLMFNHVGHLTLVARRRPTPRSRRS